MRDRRFMVGHGGELHDVTVMPWSEERMPQQQPYVRDDTLKTWIVFPSEHLRRAYVQAASAIRAATDDAKVREQRLTALIQACAGERRETEPK